MFFFIVFFVLHTVLFFSETNCDSKKNYSFVTKIEDIQIDKIQPLKIYNSFVIRDKLDLEKFDLNANPKLGGSFVLFLFSLFLLEKQAKIISFLPLLYTLSFSYVFMKANQEGRIFRKFLLKDGSYIITTEQMFQELMKKIQRS